MSKVTIATAPCSWGVWYADGTPSGTKYEVFLDQAAAAGYKALELGPDGYLPTDENKLREELSKRGLSVCAGTACYAFDSFEKFDDFRPRIDALCKRLNAFDAKYLVTMDESDVGLYSEKKVDFSAETWNKYLNMFKILGEYTKSEYGVETVYHPHIKSLIETEEEIIRLMDFTNLNLCFDTGHHAYVNGNGEKGEKSAVNFMRKYGEKIAYLHFKNVEHDIYKKVMSEHIDSDTAFDIGVMCDLEDGIIDFNEVQKAIEEISFNGIGVIEQDVPHATTEQAYASAKRNQNYLKNINIIE